MLGALHQLLADPRVPYHVRSRAIRDGKSPGVSAVWRAWSTGPDSDVKIGPAFHAFYAKDQGKDLGVTSWPAAAAETTYRPR